MGGLGGAAAATAWQNSRRWASGEAGVSTAILLLHSGEPLSSEAALSFLRRRSRLFHAFLPDALTDFLNNAWAYPSNPFLEKRIGARTRAGGGPQLFRSHEDLGTAMIANMGTITPEYKPVKAYVAHHFADDASQSIEAALRRIEDDGPKRVIVLPMTPHWWCFTSLAPINHLVQLLRRLSTATASSEKKYGFSPAEFQAYAAPKPPRVGIRLNPEGLSRFDPIAAASKGAVERQLHTYPERFHLSQSMEWSLVDRWGSHPAVADGWAAAVERELEQAFPQDVRHQTAILFAAPNWRWYGAAAYRDQVAASAARIVENLQRPLPYRLAYFNAWPQLRLPTSPLRGLRYQLVDLLFQGYRNVLIVPLVSVVPDIDSVGTLPAILPSERNLKRLGAGTVRVMRPPGASKEMALGLGELVKNHCLRGLPAPAQLPLQCELCIDPHCLHTQQLFAPSPNRLPPNPQL